MLKNWKIAHKVMLLPALAAIGLIVVVVVAVPPWPNDEPVKAHHAAKASADAPIDRRNMNLPLIQK